MPHNKVVSIQDYGELQYAIVIPARIASTRFPNKMLVEVEPGVTLIEKVFNQCVTIHPPEHVYVATDSQEIADLFPNNHVMTSEHCSNGTERVAEAAQSLTQYTYFINVQGDMIDVPLNAVSILGRCMSKGLENVMTVCKEMGDKDRNEPSTVKCINNGEIAHWFCRASLEYGDWHLGIYGYSRNALEDYLQYESYVEEEIESLEQLRWLQNFYNIGIIWTDEHASEINTPEDLRAWPESTLNK